MSENAVTPELENWMVSCPRCGVEFDLREASWCKHQPLPTKLCPNGHCICGKLKEDVWREATPEEHRHGFLFMLREAFGGKEEAKET
jgi:hypothetical protein